MSPWSPILEGANKEAARAAIEEIARAIDNYQFPSAGAGASLSSGQAGLAVFYRWLDLAERGRGYGELAERHITRTLELVDQQPMDQSLYGGLSGAAFAVELMGPEEDVNADADEAIEQHLALDQPCRGYYELVAGWVGLGVYALQRLPRASARKSLEQILLHLDRVHEETSAGITWKTPPELLPAELRAQHPNGLYNLGVAHGVPGVLALLAGMIAAGIGGGRAERLLEGGVAWLLRQELAPSPFSRFGYYAGAGTDPARTAWCYGDAGIAAVLFTCAEVARRSDWRSKALELALAAASREREHSGVIDAAICHGAVGLAHLFARFFHLTGDDRLKNAAVVWAERTLVGRTSGAPLGGFRVYGQSHGALEWIDDACLLTGSAGIGLGLLALVSEVEPTWDRFLLISVRTR